MQIKGYIDHIIFRNPDNGYTVLKLMTDDGEITLVGLLSMVSDGDMITAEGDITYSNGYGEQFSATKVEIHEPDSEEEILRYLSSGAIKGIGPALAERVVKKFGEATFEIMEREPERLAEVKGISLKKARDISESFEEKAGMRRAMMYLQQYGIGNNLAVKIYEKYGEGLYSIISENPYKISEDIAGVGFKTADEIAQNVGIERHSPHRIQAGILYELLNGSGEGNTYLPRERLVEGAVRILSLENESVENELRTLQEERKIEIRVRDEEERVYLKSLYQTEVKCARILNDLNVDYDIGYEEISRDIRKIEEKSSLTLDEDQREAVISAVRSGVFILTGGPGTGKTTIVRILLRYFMSKGLDVSLAAPTGRAAKRLTETSGMEAKTIHRLLEVSGAPGEAGDRMGDMGFGRNSDNPLETDVVIVDEMSMVDIILLKNLLNALQAGTRFIMVGDEHQLPSVGPGSVLKDILSSGRFRSQSLKKIFRQAEESDIVMNAHALLKGSSMKLDNKSRDFFFLNRTDIREITEGIIYLVKKKLPPYVKAEPSEIQVLTPMRKGPLGVENLNNVLQNAINPPSPGKRELERPGYVLREGDRVMQNKNNYQTEWQMEIPGHFLKKSGTGVFNGDMGVVERIDPVTGSVKVRFEDNRIAEYLPKNLSELELSYAVTIHKSQGSEYPAVVMPLLNGPELLMNRNLLYTGITRAKKCVVIIGSRNTVDKMASNTSEQDRFSGLRQEIERI